MLSILHIPSSLKLGGAERFTIDLAILQKESGMRAEILNLGNKGDEFVAEVVRHDIPVHHCDVKENRLNSYRLILRLISKTDVLHVHSPYVMRLIFPFLLFFPGKKIVYTRHGLLPFKTLSWKLLHQYLRLFVDAITFVTQAGEEVFLENHRWNKSKLHVVENGVLVPPEREPHQQRERIRFGSVGRLVELKGHKFLFESLREGQENCNGLKLLQNYEVSIFGSGELEDELKNFADSNLENCNVLFHGTVLDREAIYSSIDVLVVSSSTEGLSMVILEAMARAIPVIATNVGGNPSLVKDKVNGLLVEFNDTAQMAAALNSMLDNPEQISVYGENAREFIKSEYSLQKTLDIYKDLYLA